MERPHCLTREIIKGTLELMFVFEMKTTRQESPAQVAANNLQVTITLVFNQDVE